MVAQVQVPDAPFLIQLPTPDLEKKTELWPKALGPYTYMGDQVEGPGSHLHISLFLNHGAYFGSEPMNEISLSLLLSL